MGMTGIECEDAPDVNYFVSPYQLKMLNAYRFSIVPDQSRALLFIYAAGYSIETVKRYVRNLLDHSGAPE